MLATAGWRVHPVSGTDMSTVPTRNWPVGNDAIDTNIGADRVRRYPERDGRSCGPVTDVRNGGSPGSRVLLGVTASAPRS